MGLFKLELGSLSFAQMKNRYFIVTIVNHWFHILDYLEIFKVGMLSYRNSIIVYLSESV